RRETKDGQRGGGERVRGAGDHRRHPLRPAVTALRLDRPDRSGQDRIRGGLAVPALRVDDAVAPADLARPPGVSCAPPGLRRVRGGAALPILRHRPDRSGGGAGAGEAGPVLVTAAPPPGAAPEWLRELAGNAAEMTVPPPLRPPAAGTGRPSAVLMLVGETAGEPDLLIVQRSPVLRGPAGQPAVPGGAVGPAHPGPGRGALRRAAGRAR